MRENTYAESADSEGRRRIRSKTTNPTGKGKVWIGGTDGTDFWDYVDDFQELIESAHRKKGTLYYEPPQDGEPVTYELEAIHVSGLPQVGTDLNSFIASAEFEFECKPYGLLETQDWFGGLNISGPIDHIDIDDVPGHVDARAELTLNEVDSQDRSVVEVGVDPDPNPTRINLITNPKADSVITGWLGVSVTPTRVALPYAPDSVPVLELPDAETAIRASMIGGSNRVCYTVVPLGIGEEYTFSVWVFLVDISGGDQKLRVYDDDTQVVVAESDSLDFGITDWQRVSLTFTAPSTANYRVGSAQISTGDCTVYYTAAMCEKNVLRAYFDGNGPGSDWTGTEHDSTSTRIDPPFVLGWPDLSLDGTPSTRTTIANSYSDYVPYTSGTTTPVALASTGKQSHIGKWKIAARLSWVSAMQVRLAWRIGNGPWAREPWVDLSDGVTDTWYEIDLAVIDIKSIDEGQHSWEGRVEIKTASGLSDTSLDLFLLMPVYVWTKMSSGSQSDISVGALVAADDFDGHTPAANLSGLNPQVGVSNWVGVGDADDFKCDSGKVVRSVDVVDTARRINYINTSNYSSLTISATVQAKVIILALPSYTHREPGVVARYVDANNFISLRIIVAMDQSSWIQSLGFLALTKYVAGVPTDLYYNAFSYQDPAVNAEHDISLSISDDGEWIAVFDDVIVGSGTDSVLATGGTLESGAVGISDYIPYSGGVDLDSLIDDFTVRSPYYPGVSVDVPLFEGRSNKLSHEKALRESSDGTHFGTVPTVTGKYLTIPPATRSDSFSRMAIKSRRNDNSLSFQPDEGLDDELLADLTITPRVVLLGPSNQPGS